MLPEYKIKIFEAFLDIVKVLFYVLIIFFALLVGRDNVIRILDDYEKQKAITELSIKNNNQKINIETQFLTSARLLYHKLVLIDSKISEKYPINKKDISELEQKIIDCKNNLDNLVQFQSTTETSKYVFGMLLDFSITLSRISDNNISMDSLKRNCVYLQSKLSEMIYIFSPK